MIFKQIWILFIAQTFVPTFGDDVQLPTTNICPWIREYLQMDNTLHLPRIYDDERHAIDIIVEINQKILSAILIDQTQMRILKSTIDDPTTAYHHYNVTFQFCFNDKLQVWLKYLDISRNNIEKIDGDTFKNVIHYLQDVQLNNNISSSIVPKSVDDLNDLNYLDLSYNKMKIFQIANQLFKQLTHLNMSHNNLNLKADMFKMLPNLQYLNLDYNNLQKLPIRTFNYLTSLKQLSLKNNHLSDFYFGSFSGLNNLRELDVSYNQIRILKFTRFFELYHLKHLILDGNNCRNFLSHSNFIELKRVLIELETISVNDVGWSCEQLARTKIGLGLMRISLRMIPFDDEPTSNIDGIKCFV